MLKIGDKNLQNEKKMAGFQDFILHIRASLGKKIAPAQNLLQLLRGKWRDLMSSKEKHEVAYHLIKITLHRQHRAHKPQARTEHQQQQRGDGA